MSLFCQSWSQIGKCRNKHITLYLKMGLTADLTGLVMTNHVPRKIMDSTNTLRTN